MRRHSGGVALWLQSERKPRRTSPPFREMPSNAMSPTVYGSNTSSAHWILLFTLHVLFFSFRVSFATPEIKDSSVFPVLGVPIRMVINIISAMETTDPRPPKVQTREFKPVC